MIPNPQSENDLSRVLRKIEGHRRRGEFDAALNICSALIETEQSRAAGLRARANVFADMRQRELEVADREALVLIPPEEPADFFDLGVALWRIGRLSGAAGAFTRGLEVGEREDFHYYTNATRIHLVALLISLGQFEEARQQCAFLPDHYEAYLPTEGLVAKEDLAAKLTSRLRRGKG